MLSIPAFKQALLSNLISRDDGISQLNIIRADQKDFKYTAVKTEIEKAQSIVDLYTFAKEFIPILELSKNAICYYADLAEQFGRSRSGQFVTHCPDCHKNNLDDDHLDRGYC